MNGASLPVNWDAIAARIVQRLIARGVIKPTKKRSAHDWIGEVAEALRAIIERDEDANG